MRFRHPQRKENGMNNRSRSFLYGNWLMVLCACFYLAWWIITFRPPEPKGTTLGRICLICYLLYYKLPYAVGYIDGCIPLALVAVVMGWINLVVRSGIR